MKTLLTTTLLAIVIIMATACSKEETPSSVKSKISDNSWKVSYYWDKDKDETYKFQGMAFLFESDQTIDVTFSGGSESGNWLYDTSSSSHDHFIITLPDKDPFDELNDDWEVIRITDSIIELKDISGSGGTEYLTFVRI